jgi:signal transduction histidine kinase
MEDDADRSFAAVDGEMTDPRLIFISRELHDEIGGSIASVLNLLELHDHYSQNQNISGARAKISDARRALLRALQHTKELAVALRTASRLGGDPASVRDSPGPAQLPVSKNQASHRIEDEDLYAILREAVRNAISHSGAECITVQLSNSDHGLVASVEDNGAGFPTFDSESPSSLGLRSMRERAALLGGTFKLHCGPSGGTHVQITVPLNQPLRLLCGCSRSGIQRSPAVSHLL